MYGCKTIPPTTDVGGFLLFLASTPLLPTPLLPLPKSRDHVVVQSLKESELKEEERSDWLGGKPWGHCDQV